MAIYKTSKGAQVKVTRAEMRKTIMLANNWTLEEYTRQYDLFKNKLRFFEELQKSRGVEGYRKGESKEHQSPQEVLYRAARAKIRYGSEYEPSQEMQQIQSVTAHSISKGRAIAAAASGKSYKAAVAAIVNIRFSGFVDYYDKAAEILEKITDPIKQEEALTAFAEYLHTNFPRSGKDKGAAKKGEGGIYYGETFGSGDADSGSEFDITEWLE